jgi:ABC-type transport system substrate-binding protein
MIREENEFMKKYLTLVTLVVASLMLISLAPMNKVNAAAKSDLNIVWYTDSDACFAGLQAGTVDLMQGDLTKSQKETVEADPNLELAAHAENGMFEFDINNNYSIDDYKTSTNPMFCEKARQAVAFLVDKN